MPASSTPERGAALVVRPQPAADETVAALGALGIAAIACPPSRIERASPPTVPQGAEALVLTSVNGVLHSSGVLAGQTVYAVGPRTAAAAADAGAARVVQGAGDAAALLALLTAAPERHFHHLRGEDRAVDLAAALAGAGKQVSDTVVYRAVAEATPPETAVAALAQGRVRVLAVYSALGAARAARQLASWRPALAEAVAVAISPAVAEAAGALGCRAVHTAARPDGPAMAEAVARAMRPGPAGRGACPDDI